MNDKLESALAELIIKTNSGIEAGSEFILAEMPDVIQQALTWHMVHSLIMLVLGVVGLILTVAVICKLPYGKKKDDNGNYKWTVTHDDDGDIQPGFLGLLAFVIPVVVCINMINLEWLQIWVAPKVWLIEYAATLAK